MTTAVRELLDQVRRLTPEERQEVREQLRQLEDKPSITALEEEIACELEAQGIPVRRPTGKIDAEAFQAWRPIPVRGKPVSETLIEERR